MINLAKMNKEELQRFLRSSSTDEKFLKEIASRFFYAHDLGIISDLPLTLDEILDDPELSSEMLHVLYTLLPEEDANASHRAFYKIVTHVSTSQKTLIGLTSYSGCADIRYEALMRLIQHNNYHYTSFAKLSNDPCFTIKLKVAQEAPYPKLLDQMLTDSLRNGIFEGDASKKYQLWHAISQNKSAYPNTISRAKELIDKLASSRAGSCDPGNGLFMPW